MQTAHVPWPPRVGDPVGLKHYRLVGRVLSIQGSGAQQTFTVLTDPPVTTDPLVTVRLATTVGRSRGTYRLDELVPLAAHPSIAASRHDHRPQKLVSAAITAAAAGRTTTQVIAASYRQGRPADGIGTRMAIRSLPRTARGRGCRVGDPEREVAPMPHEDVPASLVGIRVRYDPGSVPPLTPDPEGDYVVIEHEPAVFTDGRHAPRFVIERRAARRP